MSFFITSFTGASGIGVNGQNGATTTPHSRTMTGIKANSYIYATGCSDNAQNFNYTFDGNNFNAFEFSHNSNKIVRGARYQEDADGDYACVTKADFGSVTNDRVEILESVAATRRIFIV